MDVGEQYDFLLNCFSKAQKEFADISPEEQPNNLANTSGECMYEMLLYAYAQKETYMPEKSVQECKLCHCGDGLCQNPPKKEGVVLHLKHNSRKEGGENCE